MPIVQHKLDVNASIEDCFDLSQSKSLRMEWDPFIREQRLIGTDEPGAGVPHWTKSKHGFEMVAHYVTFNRPTVVAMEMESGPWFFSLFAASWRFKRIEDQLTEVTFRYRFEVRRAIRLVAEPLGSWVLGRDIRQRLAAFRRGCEDPALRARLRAE